MTPPQVHHVTHPLVQHKLTLMRNKNASSTTFRTLLGELAMLMAYEVTRDMPTHLVEVQTPLETMQSPMIDGKKLVFASILRAGNGMLDGLLRVVPSARVGHIGLYRDPATLKAVEYYYKMPADLQERDVIAVDPMLATGHSAVAAQRPQIVGQIAGRQRGFAGHHAAANIHAHRRRNNGFDGWNHRANCGADAQMHIRHHRHVFEYHGQAGDIF